MINQFYIDYIKAIENPDRVGWNGKVWTAPQYKGYDKNQRGYGIDIVKNDSAKRLTQNRPGQWLTEGEADKLMKEHLLYVYGAALKHIEGFDNLSDRRKAALLGMLYRGDSVNKNRHIININEPDDNKFFESINNYYKSKGLNERAKNSSNFFNNQYFLIPMKWEQWEPPMKFKSGGQVRKMLTASGGPIINGGTPFSITVKGKDRRPAWKRMYLNPNLGDTSKYYNGNILEGVIGLAPGIGDAIDAVKAVDAVNNKDYTTAGFLGAGLLLPNIIEKPFKFVKGLYKGHKANKMMEAARKAFDESGEKLEVDAFKSGSKPMYVTPAKGPGSNHINVISDELKDSKYLDLERPFGEDITLTLRYYINEDKLKQTIRTYKDLYKERLGLYTDDVDKIYNHIISNPKLLDLNINPGTTGLLDIIGVSLGYGPKDAILFKIGYNGLNTGEKVSKDAIESMKTYGYDRTLPGIYNILKKNIERGTLGVKSTDTNGGHVGFGYVKNKLGGMLELLKNGSGIHIKEKNKGKFTSYCGGKVTDECIQKGKNSSNPAIRKRATFADNARHFKHKEGGIIKASDGTKTNFFQKAGNWINNNKDLVSSVANAGLGIVSNIKLNKAIDAQIEANEKLAEVNKQQAFMDNYTKALGMLSDRSDVVNRNKAWLIANSLNYSNDELENENILLQQSKVGILGSLGGLSTDILNAFNKKSSSNNPPSDSYFGNYVKTLFKNPNTFNSDGSFNTSLGTYKWEDGKLKNISNTYGTFNADGSMNLGNGLGTFSIKDGYKPRKFGILNS